MKDNVLTMQMVHVLMDNTLLMIHVKVVVAHANIVQVMELANNVMMEKTG